MGNERPLEVLEGAVRGVTYQNPQTGFAVLEINFGGELITAVGPLTNIAPGEEVCLHGHWDQHDVYGIQFRCETAERRPPASTAGILKYLTSGAVKGIGPATARRLVDRFGAKTLEIMENAPESLAQIPGITLARAKQIGETFRGQFRFRDVMARLAQWGIVGEDALSVYKKLGPGAVDLVTENPFLLCGDEVHFSFERADFIAGMMGRAPTSAERVRAGILHVLRHNLGNGHTCLPGDKLIKAAAELLDAEADDLDTCLAGMVEDHTLVAIKDGERLFFALPALFEAERYCAQRLKLMLHFPPAAGNGLTVDDLSAQIAALEKEFDIQYEARQLAAIRAALQQGVLILTGGPGTGKTTALNAIIRLMERRNLVIELTAPTGRAAKRMTEVTGRDAKTIHRLLEVAWSEENTQVFSRNEKNPLACDAVLVDEVSMIDACLFESLLRAVPLGCRLILVGDANQLPAVGAGNVLQDLLDYAGTEKNTASHTPLPVVSLTQIFRQAQTSLIVENAHKIVEGEYPDLSETGNDFFLLREQNVGAAAKLIADLCVQRLPAAYGYSPMTDIQVLCPSRKRELGTIRLNALLQEALNPQTGRQHEINHGSHVLREGDKVMQIRNSYDIPWTRTDGEAGSGVFNGDIGILDEINRVTGSLTVRYDDRLALYTEKDAEDLELAYAVTIHKSQGSEYECVIIPVIDAPPLLCYRNLLYTAVTRAKRLLILVGTAQAVCGMVDNNRKSKRFTLLKKLLLEDGED